MKKIAVIMFVVSLLSAALSFTVLAQSEDELISKYQNEAKLPISEIMYDSESYITLDTEGKTVWRAPFAGIAEFRVPDSFLNAKGGIRATSGSEVIPGAGLVQLDFNYIPYDTPVYKLALEKLKTAENGNSQEEYESLYWAWNDMLIPLFSVYGISGNRDEAGLRSAFLDLYKDTELSVDEVQLILDAMTVRKLGSADDFNFYMVNFADENYDSVFSGVDPAFRGEYEALTANLEQYFPCFTLMKPLGLTTFVEEGTGISFETLDLSGNPVKSADVFGAQKVTMVNLWETSCGFCISEMPKLVEMNKKFLADGAQIIGIVYDAVEEDLILEANDIVTDLNVDYLNLRPTPEIKEVFNVQSFPCTYFVNSRGEILGEPVMGVNLAKYEELVYQYLKDAN